MANWKLECLSLTNARFESFSTSQQTISCNARGNVHKASVQSEQRAPYTSTTSLLASVIITRVMISIMSVWVHLGSIIKAAILKGVLPDLTQGWKISGNSETMVWGGQMGHINIHLWGLFWSPPKVTLILKYKSQDVSNRRDTRGLLVQPLPFTDEKTQTQSGRAWIWTQVF